MGFGDEREQSEFNMAVSYLNRLNHLFYSCNASSMSLDAFGWYHSLMALFRELSTEMKPDEITSWQKKGTTINGLIRKNLDRCNRTGRQELSPDLYEELHKFELFLRNVTKKSGLQNRMQDNASFALK